MKKRIMCVGCRIIYETAKYEKKEVKCEDCGTLYLQKDCDLNITILDCLTFK